MRGESGISINKEYLQQPDTYYLNISGEAKSTNVDGAKKKAEKQEKLQRRPLPQKG